MGLPDAALEAIAASDPEPVEVHPANREALRLLLDAGTCWRAGPMGGVIGLDWSGVRAIAQMTGVGDPAEACRRVRILEDELLRIWSEARAQHA